MAKKQGDRASTNSWRAQEKSTTDFSMNFACEKKNNE